MNFNTSPMGDISDGPDHAIEKDGYDALPFEPYAGLTVPVHRYANILDVTTSEEQTALRESISALGQLEPIVLYKGAILDGRHRWSACTRLGIEPITVSLPDGADDEYALNYVLAKNLTRRNLSKQQRDKLFFQIKAEKERLLRIKAKEHELAGVTLVSDETRVDTIGELASMTGIARTRAFKLQAIERGAEENEEVADFLEQVKEGRPVSIEKGYNKAKEAKAEREAYTRSASDHASLLLIKERASLVGAIGHAHKSLLSKNSGVLVFDQTVKDQLEDLLGWVEDALSDVG